VRSGGGDHDLGEVSHVGQGSVAAAANATPRRVQAPHLRVYIERVVLDGLPLASLDGPLVQAAVEAELTRLLDEGGLEPRLTSGQATPSMPRAAFSGPADTKPASLGIQIAQAIYRRIGR
jgi:hypothetical protein